MKKVDVRRTWVPGPGGYVIAYVITCALFSLGLVFTLVPDSGNNFQIVVYWPAVVVASCVLGVPIGFLGATAAHYACRRVQAEAVHVLVSGLVAAVLVPTWLQLVVFRELWRLPDTLLVGLAAGACGALGRALARRWIRRETRGRPR